YPPAAGLAARTPLKLLRYCRKTSTHSTQATSAGAMPGDSVRGEERKLYSAAASNVSASGTQKPESKSRPPINCTAKKNVAKCDELMATKNCRASGFVGGGWWMKLKN